MNNPNVEPKYVKPLKKICMTIGQLPSSYLETMSYYEMLVWFVEFLRNQVIPALDNNAEAVRELQQLYIELKDYVDNYFDNLDVQEEINNKIDEMVESGEFEEIVSKYLDNKLNYYLVDNTFTFDKIQELFSIEESKVIEFKNGTYNFDNTFSLNKNTKIILNDAKLIFTVPHAFYNFVTTDEFLEYNGNGNIDIIGGTIDGGTIRFCHAKNININNVIFDNSLAGHILEMAAINGLKVENCTFNGGETEEIVAEIIQIDEMLYEAFPWFDSENPTYDGTPNINWLINNNLFQLNTDNNRLKFHTGIGGHYSQVNEKHSNIIITNNIFDGFDFSGVRCRQVENVLIENNKFYHAVNNEREVRTIEIQQAGNYVSINNNYVDGNINASSKFIQGNTNANELKITNNIVKNMYTIENMEIDNDCVLFLYGYTILIDNNIFDGFSKELIKISANSTQVNNIVVTRNNISNCTFTSYLIRFSTKGVYQFNYNVVNNDSVSNVLRLNQYVDKLIAKGNRINNAITDVISANGYTGDYKDVYDIVTLGYSGNSASLTNQALVVPYNNFNTLILTCGVAGSYINQYKIKGFNPQGKIGSAKYYFPAISNSSDIGKIILQTNEDGTVNYSTTNNDIVFRSIRLINE